MQNLNGIRIACIDDDPSLGRLLQRIVENSGGIFGYAKDKIDGEELLKNFSPHVLFLDVHLDNTTGLHLLTNSDFKSLVKSCSVVMLSKTKDEKVIKKSLELGADDYLFKPLNAKNVLDKIFEFTRNRKVISLSKDNEVKISIKSQIVKISEDKCVIAAPIKFFKNRDIKLKKNSVFQSYIKFKTSSDSTYKGEGEYYSVLDITGANSNDIKNFLTINQGGKGE